MKNLDAALVLDALQALDDNFRAPLAMFYLENLSYKEIAEMLELPLGTVMSRLSRGKAQLRRRLEAVLEQDAEEPPKARESLSEQGPLTWLRQAVPLIARFGRNGSGSMGSATEPHNLNVSPTELMTSREDSD
jgi:predicted DNA-binding protein YlxM (UPF0122 family)